MTIARIFLGILLLLVFQILGLLAISIACVLFDRIGYSKAVFLVGLIGVPVNIVIAIILSLILARRIIE